MSRSSLPSCRAARGRLTAPWAFGRNPGGDRAREAFSPARGGERPRWRRLPATAGILLLCATGLGSAGPAVAAPPAPAAGSAPLFVSDYSAGQVLRLPADGGPQTTVPTTGLTRPTGMAIDAAGNLYIADTGDDRVVRIPADGGPQTTVPTTGLARPIGLALDPAGDLYIADSFNDRVVEVPADGGPQRTVPTTGLLHPNGLALDRAGNLFIADFSNDRVVEVPADGSGQTTVPAVDLSQPTGLAFDTAGDLYISDSAHDRVVELPASGGPQATVPTTGLSSPQGLALDGSGNLFVADFSNNRVIGVPARGQGQTTVPFTGLSTPVGLAVPPSPAAPTGVTAVPGHGRATVTFTASTSPSVTGYTVRAIDVTHRAAGRTVRSSGSPVTVTGLTPGDSYRFTVTAANAAGAVSRASVRSEAVTILPAVRRVPTRLRAEPAAGFHHVRPPVLRIKGLSATLTRTDGRPLSGRTVAFTNTARTRKLCSATTDREGVARCDATVKDRDRGAGDGLAYDLRCHGYLATFAGSAVYRPSADTAPVRFRPRR